MNFLIVCALLLLTTAEAYKGYYKKFWKPNRGVCDPVKCDSNCKETKGSKGCPKCVCEPLCPEAKCESGCEVVDEGGCPVCSCKLDEEKFGFGDKELAKVKCSPVKCGKPCVESVVKDGCPVCICHPLCSVPKCPPGCKLQEEFEGPCPGCDCKEEFVPLEMVGKKLCEPIVCLATCKHIVDPEGCPACDCPPVCDIPKCEIGCDIEMSPEGICPSCACKEIPRHKGGIKKGGRRNCKSKFCPPSCKRLMGADGCPSCECRVICDPPKCGPGCAIEKDPKGVCPECICNHNIEQVFDEKFEEDLKPKCEPRLCLPSCKESMGLDGCPVCDCQPVCGIPKCAKGCEIENTLDGVCPGCICKEDIVEEKEIRLKPTIEMIGKCRPQLFCRPPCKRAVDEGGCSICKCRPLCAIPKCEGNCKLKKDPESGCMACDCEEDEVTKEEDIEKVMKQVCHPVKCFPHCKKVMDISGCPGCECNSKCEIPKCGRNCKVEDVPKGVCPGCFCKRRDREWRIQKINGSLEMEVLKPVQKRYRQVKKPIGGRMIEKWERID